MPKGSHTSLAKADRDDSKRGAPASNLSAFAARRGLESLGTALVGAFVGVLPAWPDYIFNTTRGVLENGRFGLVEHELYEISLRPDGDISMPGTYYSTATKNRFSFGRLIGIEGDPKNEAFAADSAWAPSTAVVLRVPEAATLPRVLIRSSDYLTFTDPSLSDDGAAGYGMVKSRFIDDALTSRLVRGEVADALTSLDQPFVEVELERGALALRVNGFITDDQTLDKLTGVAGRIAEAWAQVTRADVSGADLGSLLPPPEPDAHPVGFYRPSPEWITAFDRVAGELGLTREDPVALHRAAPHSPVPGAVIGVMRGPLGGTATVGRLLWTSQGGPSSDTVRAAAWLPARAGADTPVGGVLHEPTDMYAEIVDGSLWCWSRQRSVRKLEAETLGDRAIRTAVGLGLIDA